jgi:hypothetical protein
MLSKSLSRMRSSSATMAETSAESCCSRISKSTIVSFAIEAARSSPVQERSAGAVHEPNCNPQSKPWACHHTSEHAHPYIFEDGDEAAARGLALRHQPLRTVRLRLALPPTLTTASPVDTPEACRRQEIAPGCLHVPWL